MARPIKCRRVEFFPDENYFIPLNKRKCEIKEVILNVEELEAMRLKDIEDLNQEECAQKMQISRQTFQNIIDSARKKVAMALIHGNAIHITGGNYKSHLCDITCMNCGAVYEVNYEQDKHICPNCGSENVLCKTENLCCNKLCNKFTK